VRLDTAVSVIPILHGRSSFATHVRSLCLNCHFDCVAVDLPEPFEKPLLAAVDNLPFVSAVVASGPAEPLYYVPTDPCDAALEGLRQARQNHVRATLIGDPQLRQPAPVPAMPDEHAIERIGFDAYSSLCVRVLGEQTTPEIDRAAQYCAHRIHQLRTRHSSILALVHLRRFARTIAHYHREQTHNLTFPPSPSPEMQTHYVHPDHLYFALGELPFAAGRHERARMDPFAPHADSVTIVKDLFVETRNEYFDEQESVVELSPARLQVALTYVRNLTLMDNRFLPSLFDIVTAAKGVGGNAYAVRILKSAKYYPYLPMENSGHWLSIGIDRIRLPHEPHPRQAVNLLKDTDTVWLRIPLKPDPSTHKKRQYRFAWNPMGMCSHVPEDRRIESFNAHVRSKAMRVLSEDMVRTQKFMTSFLDGIDVRETLRNWHSGDIHVRELPPSRGEFDTVIIIFDEKHDDKYPHCATWYAEHDEESTLTFYASDPMADMVGPGIARCHYGGVSLLFPPRPIANIFQVTDPRQFSSLAQQLAYGGMLFSKERNVAYVAATKPQTALRTMAGRMGKHLIWIPLSSFSAETLRRLQRFHVLNGKSVRSWASRFIGE
jgi:hypothetical protein